MLKRMMLTWILVLFKQKRQVSKKPFSILKLDYGDVVELCKYTTNHLPIL